ncbi:MAG: hypothetical protein JWN44_2427 [Myxococcales bacterium]|nr:hypothetical protein [Myxococcales bacterium]
MTPKKAALRGSDVVGMGRLAFDAMFGLTDLVEAMHGTIVRRPAPIGAAGETHTRGLTRFVYQSIRSVTHVLGGGMDVLVPLLTPPVAEDTSSPRREVLVSVLNGVIGDHLVASENPLAIPMRFRRGGEPVALSRDALAALSPAPTGRVLVLVHGLCMNDQQWLRNGNDHGEALARAFGFSPLYLHYNSGRHVSNNGREFADRLAELIAAWPVPVDELVIVGHSMGGLVTRSACHYARLAGHGWLDRLSALVFLGTPHHGAPLERAGNLFDLLLEISPYAAPIARIGGNRAAGINDLRHGNLLDEDWDGRHRRYRADPRTPVPLPDGVDCFAVATTRGRRDGDLRDRLLGDGLVPVASALGRHADERFTLAFPESHQLVVYERDHFDLFDAPAIIDQLAIWLARP